MPIIRRKLEAKDVYPTDIRYDEGSDTVQSLVNGEWKDTPEQDPRTQTIYPPHTTDNSACDAAQAVADAIKTQIDQVIEAVGNAKTVFSIASLILALFTFGVYAIFIALAIGLGNLMLTAGKTALDAALTPSAWEAFKCIMLCQFDSTGRLKPGGFAIIQSEIDSEIGGLAATVLNAMVGLAGEGGVNNLASLGTVTGDCDDCDSCEPCGDKWTVEVGTFLGIFDGYYRFQSAVDGTTQIIQISTGVQSDCCNLLDWRFTQNGDHVAALYNKPCNSDTLGNTWTLEGCYWFLSGQVPTGDSGTVWQAEFLFSDC